MEVIFNTDKNVTGTEVLEQSVSEAIKKSLSRFDERLTRIEVHLSDQNSEKSGSRDKKCVIESRPRGMDPIVVTAQDESIQKALSSAIDKMKSALSSAIGKADAR